MGGVPPYLVLLRVGFALPAALLPRRCALTAPFHPYLALADGAVCFLWHFPSNGLEPAVPDVIRHTALRSSDFPLPTPESINSDRPAQLPTSSLYDGLSTKRSPGVKSHVSASQGTKPGMAARLIPVMKLLQIWWLGLRPDS